MNFAQIVRHLITANCFSGFGPACLQEHTDLEHILPESIYNNIVKNMEYSENCLFLDIYVPGTIQPNR